MSKDIIVEVRIKYDELMSKDELDILGIFTTSSTDAIKRKVIDTVTEKLLTDLPEIDIDLSDLKERVKERIVERKVDEVLDL